jgi:trigger factor
MNVAIEEISSIKKRLSFEVPAETVAIEIEKAYQKIGQSAKIKGFRAGKIPRPILEQYYAPQMEQQVINRLINDSYIKALDTHDINVLSDPKIIDNSLIEHGKPFTYAAEVEVSPQVTARDYADLVLQKERFVFDETSIEKQLEEMRQGRAEVVDASRDSAALGDHVVIDFAGSVDGVLFEGGSAEDFTLELGSGQFIPGFEEQVVGMKIDEARDVQVTFPEEYGSAELAGKPAVFAVTLKKVREKVAPELSDDFAKGFGLESLTELREKLTENAKTQETNRIDGDLRERLVTALIERNPLEVPETLVQNQLGYMLANIRQRLESQGMKLEMMGITEESFKQMYRDTAISQVQGTLILTAIATQEKITVDESEIDSRLEEIAKMANAPIEAVRKHYAREDARIGLMAQISEEKTIRFLLEKSQLTEVDKEELSTKEKE